MTLVTVLFLALGTAALVVGANLLVSGASGAAIGLGISPVIVGLTVVAFGTSAPELAVSIDAGLNGEVDLALGNVVGSSIANVLLILGVAAAAGGVLVADRVRRVELPLLVVVSAGTLVLAIDGSYGALDGSLLFGGFVVYAAWTVQTARRRRRRATDTGRPDSAHHHAPMAAGWLLAVRILAGLALLVVGAEWLVSSAEQVARALGVGEVVVGLTVVAIGTSLPELATTLVAARHDEHHLALGNAVGSNLFNLLAALGAAVLASPSGAAVDRDLLLVDLPVMLASSTALWLLARRTGMLGARSGTLMVSFYVSYLVVVIATASGG